MCLVLTRWFKLFRNQSLYNHLIAYNLVFQVVFNLSCCDLCVFICLVAIWLFKLFPIFHVVIFVYSSAWLQFGDSSCFQSSMLWSLCIPLLGCNLVIQVVSNLSCCDLCVFICLVTIWWFKLFPIFHVVIFVYSSDWSQLGDLSCSQSSLCCNHLCVNWVHNLVILIDTQFIETIWFQPQHCYSVLLFRVTFWLPSLQSMMSSLFFHLY
jgi:hypothetical protein